MHHHGPEESNLYIWIVGYKPCNFHIRAFVTFSNLAADDQNFFSFKHVSIFSIMFVKQNTKSLSILFTAENECLIYCM